MTEFIQYEGEDWGNTESIVWRKVNSKVYNAVSCKVSDKVIIRASIRVSDGPVHRVWHRVRGRIYEETKK